MFAIIQAAGWPIWPLLIASVIALALIIERIYSLRRPKVLPIGLLQSVFATLERGGYDAKGLDALEESSPLGRVLAAGIRNQNSSREVMREAIEEAGRMVYLQLERYLTTLGTIASVAPLLGLLGTLVGMIDIFGAQSPGSGNPQQLAYGISVALYNTTLGLLIAIPALVFWRHFRALVDKFVVDMEQQAIKLVEVIHGERR